MSNPHEIERITPGPQYPTYEYKELQALNKRIVNLETILSQHVTQWNAPKLIRSAGANTLVQYGTLAVDHSDTWSGVGTEKALTFTTEFSDTPLVLCTMRASSLNTGWDDTYAANVAATGVTIGVKASSDPTSGTAYVAWIAIGESK